MTGGREIQGGNKSNYPTKLCVCVCVRPALSGVELEEDAEAVPQSGVVLSDGVVPQQHQTGEHLSAGDSAGVH